MLQISNLRLEVGDGPEVLRRKAAKALGIPLGDLLELSGRSRTSIWCAPSK